MDARRPSFAGIKRFPNEIPVGRQPVAFVVWVDYERTECLKTLGLLEPREMSSILRFVEHERRLGPRPLGGVSRTPHVQIAHGIAGDVAARAVRRRESIELVLAQEVLVLWIARRQTLMEIFPCRAAID